MIENTGRRDPLIHLAGMLGGGGVGGYIEEMEAQGARQVQGNDQLPTQCRDSDDELRALGFVLGEPIKGDTLFRSASLPAGWRKDGTGHSMWTRILDDSGRERATIFYKAAWYDRDAHMSLTTVQGYVWKCLHEQTLPRLDSTWATATAVVEAIKVLKARNEETRELYSRPGVSEREGDYATERIAEVNAEDELLDAMARAVTGEAPTTTT